MATKPISDPQAAPVANDKPFYGPQDVAGIDYARDLANPGEFPFTRGIHPEMYRKRTWTMRQFAGFGSAEDTNERFKYLLGQGQTGLSTAFDLPTLMGRDSDDPLSLGEVGKCGVAVSSLDDMRRLFDGIALDQVSTSMTINAPAAILLAFYIAVAEEQGVGPDKLRGTLQNDILKEFHAQNEYVFPPRPSVKLVTDTIEYGTHHMPQWNTVSISGYHIREAGASAAQELAFTLADGMSYVEHALERGLDVDEFSKRLSFFFDVHNDFFEEIAKIRAARRIWAKVMRDKYGAKLERNWWMRCHAQTAGVTLTEQQPTNNVVRVAYQALAAVLAGVQSLHTNSMDETLALPTENAVKLALRTQQIIACETNVTSVADPLGGSWFIENKTNEMEAEANAIFREIDDLGGVVGAIEHGYFRRSIADSAIKQSLAFDSGEAEVVGVNKYVEKDYERIDVLKIGADVEKQQVARLQQLKRDRDAKRHQQSLEALRKAAADDANVMPFLIDAAKADATVGEMMEVMARVFGRYDGGPEW